MSNSAIYVGIDVDDNSFHFRAFFQKTGEMLEYKSRPTLKSLAIKLEEIKIKFPLHIVFPEFIFNHFFVEMEFIINLKQRPLPIGVNTISDG